jgi:hypothetical protein
MIEAIKSTLSVAPIVAKATEQSSSTKAFATNPDKVQEVAVVDDGHYATRNVRVDNTAKVAILEFRNPLNGDVKTQIPTEAQLEAYERQAIQDEIAQQNQLA